MLITKYEHAHMVFELQDRRLVIDPGSFSPLREASTDVDALIITHEHADHWTPEHIAALVAQNPNLHVFTTAATATMLRELGDMVQASQISVVQAGQTFTVGPFTLSFHGAKHAVLHSSIPVIDNVGVCINGMVYFGGDALEPPTDAQFEYLALPIGSPWSNVGEVMDYVDAIQPAQAFAVHEMMLSERGVTFYERFITGVLERNGGTLRRLPFGEPVQL